MGEIIIRSYADWQRYEIKTKGSKVFYGVTNKNKRQMYDEYYQRVTTLAKEKAQKESVKPTIQEAENLADPNTGLIYVKIGHDQYETLTPQQYASKTKGELKTYKTRPKETYQREVAKQTQNIREGYTQQPIKKTSSATHYETTKTKTGIISAKQTNTTSLYATPTAARVLRDIGHPDAKKVKVSYGKYNITQSMTQSEYDTYKQYGEGYYAKARKPSPLSQTIIPTNVKSVNSIYGSQAVSYNKKNLAAQTKKNIAFQQEVIKAERPYAKTYEQARLMKVDKAKYYRPEGKPVPTYTINPVTKAIQPTTGYATVTTIENPKKKNWWEKANKKVKGKVNLGVFFDFNPKYTEYAKSNKGYMQDQQQLLSTAKYIKDKPLAVPVAVGAGYLYSKAGRGVKWLAGTKYIRPLVSKSNKVFWNSKVMSSVKNTAPFQRFMYNKGSSKLMFGAVYVVPKTMQYASATTEQQRSEIRGSIPVEIGGFYVGGRLAVKTPLKATVSNLSQKYREYKFNKKIDSMGNKVAWEQPTTKTSIVYVTNEPFTGKSEKLAGYDVINVKKMVTLKAKAGKVNPYYTAPTEKQTVLYKTRRSYDPINDVLGSGYYPTVSAAKGKMIGQYTMSRYNPLPERTIRLMQVKGMRGELKVDTKPYYQRRITEYQPIKQNKYDITRDIRTGNYIPKKPTITTRITDTLDRFSFAPGTRGKYSVSVGSTQTVGQYKLNSVPETNFKRPYKMKSYTKSGIKPVTTTKTRLISGVAFPQGSYNPTKVYLNNPPEISLNPSKTRFNTIPTLRSGIIQKQNQKVAILQTTGQINLLKNVPLTTQPNPNIIKPGSFKDFVIRPGGGSSGSPIPPPPRLPSFDWPGASYSGGLSVIRKTRAQPKAYTPSGFAAGFGIKGKPTKFGIKSGLGLRPIKV